MPGNVTSLSLLLLWIGNCGMDQLSGLLRVREQNPWQGITWDARCLTLLPNCFSKCLLSTFSKNPATKLSRAWAGMEKDSEALFFSDGFIWDDYGLDGLDPELIGVEGLGWPEGFSPAREGLKLLLGIACLPAWRKASVPWKWKSAVGWFQGVPLLFN